MNGGGSTLSSDFYLLIIVGLGSCELSWTDSYFEARECNFVA